MIDYIGKILDIIKYLGAKDFTGVLYLELEFNQGGIRNAKETVEKKIK